MSWHVILKFFWISDKKKVFCTLNQPPYRFRRKLDASGSLVGSCCSGCESDGNDEYHLKRLPTAEEHACVQDWTEILKKKCIAKMMVNVEKDPTKPITDIYHEVRSKFTKHIGVDEKITFLQNFPKFLMENNFV